MRTRMKYVSLLLFFGLFFSEIFGKVLPEKNIRTKINFKSDWKFVLIDKAGFESPVFDDITWHSLDLPHDWSIEGKLFITIQATAVKKPVKIKLQSAGLKPAEHSIQAISGKP